MNAASVNKCTVTKLKIAQRMISLARLTLFPFRSLCLSGVIVRFVSMWLHGQPFRLGIVHSGIKLWFVFKGDQTRDWYPAGLYLFPPFITGQLGKASKKFSRVFKLSYLLDSKEVQGFSASAPRRAIRDIGFAGNSLNPTIGGCQRVHGIKLTDHIPHGWAGTQPFYGAETGGIIIHPPDWTAVFQKRLELPAYQNHHIQLNLTN